MVRPVFSTRYDDLLFRVKKLERLCTLNQVNKFWFHIWWNYWPGTKIKVRWPNGYTEPDHLGNSKQSADPNDHYRPWMELHVGKQGWDWNWNLEGSDIKNNQLTIKIRKKKAKFASVILLKWS